MAHRKLLSATTVLVTLFVDAVSVGIILPVLPDLLIGLSGADVAGAALWSGVLAMSYATMLFLFGPIMGGLSDRFGRRPVLLGSLIAMCIDYILLSFAESITLLFFGRMIAGIAGATYAVGSACLADMTPLESRAKAFGMVGGAFALGLVFGPAIGGLVAGLGPRAPFMAAATLAGANALAVWFLLPETLGMQNRSSAGGLGANPLAAFWRLRQMPGPASLALVILLISIAHQVYPAILPYYTIEIFGFSALAIGLLVTALGLCMEVVQGWLVGTVVVFLGERRTIGIGLGVNIVVLAAVTFVDKLPVFIAFLPLMALGFIVGPVVQSQMSRGIGAEGQGALMGLMSSLAALALIIGPLMMTGVFKAFSGPDAMFLLPGAPFAAAASLMVVALAIFHFGRSGVPSASTTETRVVSGCRSAGTTKENKRTPGWRNDAEAE